MLMTRRSRFALSHSFYASLMITAAAGFHGDRISCAAYCGITDSFNALSSSVDQINRFFTAAAEFMATLKAILTATGMATVVLFLAVILISTGLSALGVPRSKLSFIISLAAADSFWFAWEKALGNAAAGFLPGMIKSNAILLAPVALVACLSFAAPLAKKLWLKSVHLIRNVKKNEYSPDSAMELMIELDRKAASLRESIMNDTKLGLKKRSFPLSGATIEARQSLEKTLKKI